MYKELWMGILFLVLGACSSINVKSLTEAQGPKETYEEGLKLVQVEEYSRAIEYFQYVIEKHGKSLEEPSVETEREKYFSWSLYEIGFCYYRMGEKEKALDYFNRVLLQAKSRSPRILANLLRNKIQAGNGYKNASYN